MTSPKELEGVRIESVPDPEEGCIEVVVVLTPEAAERLAKREAGLARNWRWLEKQGRCQRRESREEMEESEAFAAALLEAAREQGTPKT